MKATIPLLYFFIILNVESIDSNLNVSSNKHSENISVEVLQINVSTNACQTRIKAQLGNDTMVCADNQRSSIADGCSMCNSHSISVWSVLVSAGRESEHTSTSLRNLIKHTQAAKAIKRIAITTMAAVK